MDYGGKTPRSNECKYKILIKRTRRQIWVLYYSHKYFPLFSEIRNIRNLISEFTLDKKAFKQVKNDFYNYQTKNIIELQYQTTYGEVSINDKLTVTKCKKYANKLSSLSNICSQLLSSLSHIQYLQWATSAIIHYLFWANSVGNIRFIDVNLWQLITFKELHLSLLTTIIKPHLWLFICFFERPLWLKLPSLSHICANYYLYWATYLTKPNIHWSTFVPSNYLHWATSVTTSPRLLQQACAWRIKIKKSSVSWYCTILVFLF